MGENLELAENKKMEKRRKVNVQEIPKIQRVENDDYIHYVDASDTKFLPIISQQAVKKNGEVKTILELAENKKAENADSGVKKNEEAKIILERAEIRGNKEENSGEHEEENSGEHEEENSGELEEENSEEH